MQVWRGDETGGKLRLYEVEVHEGEVVLDVVHRLQATQTPDLAADGTGSIAIRRQPLPVMPPELLGLFERGELSKYMTDAELERLPKPAGSEAEAVR